MKSNYKRLGTYIREVKDKNGDMLATNLQGVNIDKFFMPSVANIVGTDLSAYKKVKKNQFACNRMHVGRDYRLPVALSNSGEDFIVSPAYDVFEIIDTNVLLAEYLMMWFTRTEFDRNAWFYTDADVRGGLPWKSFCEMQLPIPSPEKQKEIVKEYNTIVNRIKLNEQLCQKLEETAQALYKQWFVDFEFPDENGNPYKSSGGEMVYCDELKMEVPKGWVDGCIRDISDQFFGYSFEGELYSLTEGVSVLRGENVSEKRLRWDTHKKWAEKIDVRIEKCYLKKNDIVIGMDGSKVGKNYSLVSQYDLPLLIAQRVSCLRAFDPNFQFFIYFSMIVKSFEDYVSQIQTGTSIPHISGGQIYDFPLIIPTKKIIIEYNLAIEKITNAYMSWNRQNSILSDLKNILLSKLATIEN